MLGLVADFRLGDGRQQVRTLRLELATNQQVNLVQGSRGSLGTGAVARSAPNSLEMGLLPGQLVKPGLIQIDSLVDFPISRYWVLIFLNTNTALSLALDIVIGF